MGIGDAIVAHIKLQIAYRLLLYNLVVEWKVARLGGNIVLACKLLYGNFVWGYYANSCLCAIGKCQRESISAKTILAPKVSKR